MLHLDPDLTFDITRDFGSTISAKGESNNLTVLSLSRGSQLIFHSIKAKNVVTVRVRLHETA